MNESYIYKCAEEITERQRVGGNWDIPKLDAWDYLEQPRDITNLTDFTSGYLRRRGFQRLPEHILKGFEELEPRGEVDLKGLFKDSWGDDWEEAYRSAIEYGQEHNLPWDLRRTFGEDAGSTSWSYGEPSFRDPINPIIEFPKTRDRYDDIRNADVTREAMDEEEWFGFSRHYGGLVEGQRFSPESSLRHEGVHKYQLTPRDVSDQVSILLEGLEGELTDAPLQEQIDILKERNRQHREVSDLRNWPYEKITPEYRNQLSAEEINYPLDVPSEAFPPASAIRQTANWVDGKIIKTPEEYFTFLNKPREELGGRSFNDLTISDLTTLEFPSEMSEFKRALVYRAMNDFQHRDKLDEIWSHIIPSLVKEQDPYSRKHASEDYIYKCAEELPPSAYVYGFEPWGDMEYNISGGIINRLRDLPDTLYNLHTDILPTDETFDYTSFLTDRIKETNPGLVIGMGRRGSSIKDSLPFIGNKRDIDIETIAGDLHNTASFNRLQSILEDEGFITNLSEDAGEWICEETYEAILNQSLGDPETNAYFLHLIERHWNDGEDKFVNAIDEFMRDQLAGL